MNDDELRDLQERVQLITELTQQPGWTMFYDRVAADVEISQRRLMNGHLPDYLEYQKEVAKLNGMLLVLNLPAQVQSELDDEMAARAEQEEPEEAESG